MPHSATRSPARAAARARVRASALAGTFALTLALSLAPTAPASAASNPIDNLRAGMATIAQWFEKLGTDPDTAADQARALQLQQSVDRLRRDLYRLEVDARMLMDSVPDERPGPLQRARLDSMAETLQGTVHRLMQSTREVGAELRLNEAEAVEATLMTGLRTRSGVVREFRQALLPASTAPWDGPRIRARLLEGVDAVRLAQLAVSAFSQQLAASAAPR